MLRCSGELAIWKGNPHYMIRKVVIPAAGKGTRMLDLSQDRPKHLIEVLDRPFLYYVLRSLNQAGFEEMVLVIGYQAARMEEFVATTGKEFPITLVNQFQELGTEKYGTALPVLAARDTIGEDDFVCVFGDNLHSHLDLAAVRELDDEFSYLSLLYSETPEKYGVPILENDRVVRIVEKPRQFISNWVATGCYKFTSDVFQKCEKLTPSDRGEYELTDVIGALAADGGVKARKITDYCLDFGNPDDIETVARFLREGRLQ